MLSDENEGKSAGKRVGALLTQQVSSSRRTGAAFTLGNSSYERRVYSKEARLAQHTPVHALKQMSRQE